MKFMKRFFKDGEVLSGNFPRQMFYPILILLFLITSTPNILASLSYPENKSTTLEIKHVTVEDSLSAIVLPPATMSVQQPSKSITGTVKDSNGQPIPGATVVVKGTTTGITTDNKCNIIITFIPFSDKWKAIRYTNNYMFYL